MKEMTGKQGILAALKKESVDRILWAPLFGPYAMAGFDENLPQHIPDLHERVGADAMIRHQSTIDVIEE
jgi:hypothetical protein